MVFITDTGSNSGSVLDLRPLTKVPGYTKAGRQLLGACRPSWWSRVSGSHQGEAAEFIRHKQAKTWLCEGLCTAWACEGKN